MAKSKKPKDSEYRLYDFISQSLKEIGWNVKNPCRYADGEVYYQNECLADESIKAVLNKDRPENIVVVDENIYWVIEAKSDYSDISKAVDEAKNFYARKINKSKKNKVQVCNWHSW